MRCRREAGSCSCCESVCFEAAGLDVYTWCAQGACGPGFVMHGRTVLLRGPGTPVSAQAALQHGPVQCLSPEPSSHLTYCTAAWPQLSSGAGMSTCSLHGLSRAVNQTASRKFQLAPALTS